MHHVLEAVIQWAQVEKHTWFLHLDVELWASECGNLEMSLTWILNLVFPRTASDFLFSYCLFHSVSVCAHDQGGHLKSLAKFAVVAEGAGHEGWV